MATQPETARVEQVDRVQANKAFDIAFRGETDGIDEAMALLFARHRATAYAAGLARAAEIAEDAQQLMAAQGSMSSEREFVGAKEVAAEIAAAIRTEIGEKP